MRTMSPFLLRYRRNQKRLTQHKAETANNNNLASKLSAHIMNNIIATKNPTRSCSILCSLLICKTPFCERGVCASRHLVFLSNMLCYSAPNGLRYPRVGGRGQNFDSRILLGRRESPKMPQNPTHPLHALLGGSQVGYREQYQYLLFSSGKEKSFKNDTAHDRDDRNDCDTRPSIV